MDDVKLPDLSKVRGSDSKRELPSQTSANDTSNWDNRAIALPDPKRSSAKFILADTDSDLVAIPDITNPYVEQERLKSVKRKK